MMKNYDPTRTTVLRNQFASQMKKRFDRLVRSIKEAIVDQDCFGLNNQFNISFRSIEMNAGPGAKAFDFPRSQDKIQGFMSWLKQQEDIEITTAEQVGRGIEDAWTNQYIQTAYQKGIYRGRQELVNAGMSVPTIAETGGINIAFNTPFHLDKVGVIYTRAYNELKGITGAMDQQISRVLAQGIADGNGPKILARNLRKAITGEGLGITDSLGRYIPAKRRATMLARTEIIRAHHLATIQEYENWGVEGVKVKAEWKTAGDGRVCPDCAGMEGSVYTLEEIKNMIPKHPQCRCVALPYMGEKEVKGSKVKDKPIEPVEPIEEWRNDPIASNLINQEHGKIYYDAKKEYSEKLTELIEPEILKTRSADFEKLVVRNIDDKLLDFIGEDTSLSKMELFGDEWQKDTALDIPMKLKIKAFEMEKNLPKVVYESGLSKNNYSNDLYSVMFTDEDYLKIRAFNQAYMEILEQDVYTLYRGTDGKTGKKIRNYIIEESNKTEVKRTKWHMTDSALTGYTSNIKTANSFGANVGGVTVRLEVNKADIIIHKDLISGITRKHYGEKEFIVRGIDRPVDIKDIRFAGKGFDKAIEEVIEEK